MLTFDVFLYTMYEYNQKPLAFIVLPTEPTDAQKLELLRIADELYANTAQETTDWALEYQLWVRMMLCDSVCSLPVNTFAHHLSLGQENIEKICDVLGADSKNAAVFRTCAENKTLHDLVCRLLNNDPDCYEGFSVNEEDGIFWFTM